MKSLAYYDGSEVAFGAGDAEKAEVLLRSAHV